MPLLCLSGQLTGRPQTACDTMMLFTTPSDGTALLLSALPPPAHEAVDSDDPRKPRVHGVATSSSSTAEARASAAVRAHYERLLRRVRTGVEAARDTSTVSAAHIASDADAAVCTRVMVDTDWLYRMPADAAHQERGVEGEAGEEGEEGGDEPQTAADSEKLTPLLHKALTRWAALAPSMGRVSNTTTTTNSSQARARAASAASPVPSTLVVVVLQDTDFDVFSDGWEVLPSCPSLGLLPPRPEWRKAPVLDPTAAATATLVPCTVKVVVVTGAFLIHSLFFQAWCRPQAFLFHPTAHTKRLSCAAPRLSVRVPWSTPSLTSSAVTSSLVDFVFDTGAVPGDACSPLPRAPTCAVDLIGGGGDGGTGGEESAADFVGAVLQHHLALADPFTLQPVDGDPLSVKEAAVPELQQWRAALLLPRDLPRASATPNAAPSSPSSRKRHRSCDPDTEDVDGDDKATAPEFTDCREAHGDLFMDADAPSPALAAETKRLTGQSLLPTPLYRRACVAQAALGDVRSAYTVDAEVARLPDEDEDEDEAWRWWSASELATLRLRVDWRALRQQGWRLASDGTALTEAQSRAVDKAKRVMDCLHVQRVCGRHHHFSKTAASAGEDEAEALAVVEESATQALLERALGRRVGRPATAHSDHGDEDDDAVTPAGALRPCVLSSRVRGRVTRSLHQLSADAPARALLSEVMTHMPDASAGAAFDAPVWQRAVLQAPHLSLAPLTPDTTVDAAATPHEALADPVAELSDWLFAACTLPSVRDTAEVRAVKEETTILPSPSVCADGLVRLPVNRVYTFFREAFTTFLHTSLLPVPCAVPESGDRARPVDADSSCAAPDDIALTVARHTLPTPAATRAVWREVVWLVVQAHKTEVAAMLGLFPPSTTSTVLPSPALSDAPMVVLRQFWEQVAEEVIDVLSEELSEPWCGLADQETATDDSQTSTAASLTSLMDVAHAAAEEEEEEEEEEDEGEEDATAPSAPFSRVPPTFTGFDALCLYLDGPPPFTALTASRLSTKSTASTDEVVPPPHPVDAPWLRHLLFLLANAEPDPLAYVSPQAYTVAMFDTAPLTPPALPPTLTRPQTACPAALLRHEQLAARQVAAEAREDVLDQVISTAYAAYTTRWKHALTWLDAASHVAA